MRDSQHYDRPNEFLPFRFVANHPKSESKNVDKDEYEYESKDEIDDEAAQQKFTDLKPHFYIWGAAKNPWWVSHPLFHFSPFLPSFPPFLPPRFFAHKKPLT